MILGKVILGHGISQVTLKYQNLDEALRAEKRAQWNKPVIWPLVLFVALLIAIGVPGWLAFKGRLNKTVAASNSQGGVDA